MQNEFLQPSDALSLWNLWNHLFLRARCARTGREDCDTLFRSLGNGYNQLIDTLEEENNYGWMSQCTYHLNAPFSYNYLSWHLHCWFMSYSTS